MEREIYNWSNIIDFCVLIKKINFRKFLLHKINNSCRNFAGLCISKKFIQIQLGGLNFLWIQFYRFLTQQKFDPSKYFLL